MSSQGCLGRYYATTNRVISSMFRSYGEFVGKWPWVFISLNILVFGGLGFGLSIQERETDLEKLYFPQNSQASRDREIVRKTFPDLRATFYNSMSLSDTDNAVNVIFRCKAAGQNIFSPVVASEISAIVLAVEGLVSSTSGKNYTRICAKQSSQCYVDGKIAISPMFISAVNASRVTYPVWNQHVLPTFLADVQIGASAALQSAKVLKVSFKLKEEDSGWLSAFLRYANALEPMYTDLAYGTPNSLSEELDKSTKGDKKYFSNTATAVLVYAYLVGTGGNSVSTRVDLAFGGILATLLGILGSFGLLCACGVKLNNMVDTVAYLITCIGVDDMFVLMSCWSESLPEKVEEQTVEHVPKILGKTLAKAGVGITITSLTDILAFVVGTYSDFLSVTIFSLYAGVAVLFCYIANASLFSACLALHGRRVYSNRHSLTCKVVQRQQEGEDKFCRGGPPKGPGDDQSIFEKLPSWLLPKIFKYTFVNIVIVMLFVGYLAVAIYGATKLQQGLELQHLVQDTSYYRKFLTVSDHYFPARIPVAFVVTEKQDYNADGAIELNKLLAEAQRDKGMDHNFRRCWLDSYNTSAFYDATNFLTGLHNFLVSRPDFQGDVVFDGANSSVLASRCFVMSEPSTDHYSNAEMMKRMRLLAENSPLPAFAYHSAFVAFEEFLAVLPSTLQLVGIAVAVMTVVTFILIPDPLMVLLVVLTIVMILTGIFGFMHFWDLTLSSITMIHLVMSVGLSVDYSAHVCAAYMQSPQIERQDRAADAIRHAAAPILNGAASTLLGVAFISALTSYIFQSFFKVMVLVIGFGFLHAVFFLPAILSLIGPTNQIQKDKTISKVADANSIQLPRPTTSSGTNLDLAAAKLGSETSSIASTTTISTTKKQ